MTKADLAPYEALAPAAVPVAAIELQSLKPEVLIARMRATEDVVREVMVEGVHYGPIPGVPGKNMLDKAGTEILAATFGLALDPEITETSDEKGKRFTVKCRVLHQPTGQFLGSGVGYASTLESAFHWRRAVSKKEYDATPADQRREKHNKRGGIDLQVVEDPEDKANTIIKMATKRAASDAVLGVLGVRGMVLTAEGDTQRPGVTSEELQKTLQFAAGKGLSESQVSERLRKALGYDGDLADLPRKKWEWLVRKLSSMPDVADPSTGEVVSGESDEELDDNIPFGDDSADAAVAAPEPPGDAEVPDGTDDASDADLAEVDALSTPADTAEDAQEQRIADDVTDSTADPHSATHAAQRARQAMLGEQEARS
jgi:hypothetical protein